MSLILDNVREDAEDSPGRPSRAKRKILVVAPSSISLIYGPDFCMNRVKSARFDSASGRTGR
jgi:hypothetical protein